MDSLSQKEIDHRFNVVKHEVEQRWNLFANDQSFPFYSSNWKQEAALREFEHFHDLRLNCWKHPLFKLPEALLRQKRYRESDCITFEHSATDETYNATCIEVDGRRFIALEGPLKQHVAHFFDLLAKWNVTSLVCLTNEADPDGKPKCHPYWSEKTVGNNDSLCLKVHGKEIPYLYWPDWKDNHGTCPAKLAYALKQVCKRTPPGGIMAVHCSAGVGRTGTFISSVCLYDAIERQKSKGIAPDQIKINIAQLFLYLNLYRPRFVCNQDQYLTLYKTVDFLVK